MAVHIFGSINLDHVAFVERFTRSGETAHGRYQALEGGKGANQSVAAARNGVETILYGATGRDAAGDHLMGFLAAQGVDVAGVERVEEHTGVALIEVTDAGENRITVCPGANLRAEAASAAARIQPGDVAVIQGETDPIAAAAFILRASDRGALTLANLAPFFEPSKELREALTYVIVNETEFSDLIGEGDFVERPELLLKDPAKTPEGVIVTLGPLGAVMRRGSQLVQKRALQITPVDTTGAGDCCVGNFAAELSRGAAVEDALRFAVAAASMSAERVGASASMPKRAEVLARLESEPQE